MVKSKSTDKVKIIFEYLSMPKNRKTIRSMSLSWILLDNEILPEVKIEYEK